MAGTGRRIVAPDAFSALVAAAAPPHISPIMPDGTDSLTARTVARIADVPARAWDACAGDDNPFVSHAFLSALEESGSVTAETGWLPRHLVLEDAEGRVLACAPMYLKSHSYGEYVFDWAWADAFHRAGGQYYPKLQVAVPFTPVTGPRLLLAPGVPEEETREVLASTLVRVARKMGVSSLHVTFAEADEVDHLGRLGFLVRHDQQYHWDNRGYASFDDFLATLSSRKRKDIRKERAKANAQGVRLLTLTGGAIEPRHWDAFYRFYLDTSDRKWGQAYLNREFFERLGATMADKVVLVMGEDEDTGRLVCGALNLRGRETLYGRNWGADEHYAFLHFEACYYRAIDFAIDQGLKRVEAGAQGQHKVQRGYLPNRTQSAHWIAEPRFRTAVARYLDEERDAVAEDMAVLSDHGPYRKDC